MNVTCIGVPDFHLSHYHKRWFIGSVWRWGCGDYAKLARIISEPPQSRGPTEEWYYLCYSNSALHLKAGGGESACQFSYRRLIYFELLLKLASMWEFFHNDLSSTVYMRYRLPRLTGPSLIKSVKLWIYSQACKINEVKDLIQYRSRFCNFSIGSFLFRTAGSVQTSSFMLLQRYLQTFILPRRPWIDRYPATCGLGTGLHW